VLHELVGLVLRVEDREVREDARVGLVEPEALLEEADELVEVPELVVAIEELLQVVLQVLKPLVAPLTGEAL